MSSCWHFTSTHFLSLNYTPIPQNSINSPVSLNHTHHTSVRHQHNQYQPNDLKAPHMHLTRLLLFSPSLKQVQQIHDPGLFQFGYSQSNHRKGDSQVTRSKISYSLIQALLLPCAPACGYELRALAVHPHPTLAAPPIRSALAIQSEVCGRASLWEHSTRG